MREANRGGNLQARIKHVNESAILFSEKFFDFLADP